MFFSMFRGKDSMPNFLIPAQREFEVALLKDLSVFWTQVLERCRARLPSSKTWYGILRRLLGHTVKNSRFSIWNVFACHAGLLL